MVIGRLLYADSKNDILELKKIGHSKINIRLKTGEAANKLISSQIFKEKKYNVYIPLYRVARKGIIRGVPLDLTEGEILKGLEAKSVIISIQRLNRRKREISVSTHNNESASGNLIPSQTVLITFRGQSLPEYLFLYMMRYTISPFVSKTSLCFSCFRFRHISSQCKGHARCLLCGNKKHADEESCPSKDGPPVCINCGRPHKASSFDCPEYLF